MDIDLKLLGIFDEVYKTRSVSQAGENLGLSQPSISLALGKLRRYFNDPLFVRTSSGMEPTPHAAELIAPIREALELLRFALKHQVVFDPARSDRTFRICMTDISQVVMLPRIMNRLKDAAPSIRVETLHISADTPKLLEFGDADLAIGYLPQLEAGFYQQQLFRQTLVCMVRRDHPRIADALSLAQYEQESHVAVAASGTGHWILDKTLEDQRIARRIALRLPNFLGIGRVVASTDLIATVPRLLGEILAETERVRLLEPPMSLPAYAVKQHWHERYHHDHGNRWLRGVVAELFGAAD